MFTRIQRSAKNEHGSILVLAFIYIVVISIIGAAASQLAITEKRLAARSSIYTDELAAAEYGLNKLVSELDFLSRYHEPGLEEFDTIVDTVTLPELEGFSLTSDNPIENIAFFMGDPTGDFPSPYVFNYKYKLRLRAKSTDVTSQRFAHPGVEVEQIVFLQYLPINMFGIFSNLDWEIIPGPRYDMYGKVHCNGDLVFDAHTGAYYYDTITAAGRVLGGAHNVPNRHDEGRTVYVTNGEGAMPSMYQNGWIDNLSANWKETAEERWNGYVRDVAHGVMPLELAMPWTEDPHAIVERMNPADPESVRHIKFDWLSGFRLIRNDSGVLVAFARSPMDETWTSVPIEYPDPEDPDSMISPFDDTKYFWDSREDCRMDVLEIDMEKFYDYTEWLSETYDIEYNRIIYLSETTDGTSKPAVRIVNGADTPDNGIIIASDNPVYVKGNFNVDTNFAIIAGDSINILSNAWRDSLNLVEDYVIRTASTTTTNAIFIGGITPSSDQYSYPDCYSGGAENFYRYLENWDGVTHTFYGSIVNMFESQTAIGRWFYGSPVYTAPRRNWHWDAFGFERMAGTPHVRRIVRSEWKLVSQDE